MLPRLGNGTVNMNYQHDTHNVNLPPQKDPQMLAALRQSAGSCRKVNVKNVSFQISLGG